MKDKGSRLSSSSLSKCVMVASMSSSQNGGFASNEPHWGLKSKMFLKKYKKVVKMPSPKLSKVLYFMQCQRSSSALIRNFILPSGPEVRVDIGKGRAILAEVAVER